ncbi:MAG: hypothetical protein KF832_01905 [Caldilineaceae bacterium]|nr:hypothetical protein [Caldilineaceae bacterium]
MLQGKTFITKTASIIAACGIIGMTSVALAQSDSPTPATDTGQHRVFLPLVSGQNSSIIHEMAAWLPDNSDCKNCLTRETFLALPAEELARIEKSEIETRRLAERLQQQEEWLQQMIANGEIDTSNWPTTEQIAAMTPEEVAEVSAEQNALLASFVSSADVDSTDAINVTVYIANLPAANITDNINSCGPASIRVALSTRKATSQIDSIKTIGETIDKNPDETQGNWKDGLESEDIPRMATYLNTQLGFGANNPYYSPKSSNSAVTFQARVATTTNNNLSMIFGVMSGVLPDWTLNRAHIVTAYATVNNSQGQPVISWADTSPIVSGHYKVVNGVAVTGAYYNARLATDLWQNSARYNNFQISN